MAKKESPYKYIRCTMNSRGPQLYRIGKAEQMREQNERKKAERRPGEKAK
jgi:hypothetical protein